MAADALGAARVGVIGLAIAQRHVDRVVTVPDDAIVAAHGPPCGARLQLGGRARRGDARSPRLLASAYVPEHGERVGVVVCGGNADPMTLDPTGGA